MNGCEPHPDLVGLERAIGRALRWGTVASSILLAAGLLMMFTGYGDGIAQRVAEIGLVILVATPVVRVMISFVEYLKDRDWLFVTMTAIVLMSLAGSVAAAFLY